MTLLLDPEVSRAKFDREIKNYRENESAYIARGWLLLKAEYPEVFVIQCTTHLPPPFSALIGIRIDFTNYDLIPPSVHLVHPFNGVAYDTKELIPIKFIRFTRDSNGKIAPQDIIQAHFGKPPFICLPGIREYHTHPAHSGDNWLLRRGRGEGTLYFILDQLHKYGVSRAGMNIMNIELSAIPIFKESLIE